MSGCHRKRDNDAPENQEANHRHRNRDDDPPAKLSYFEKRLSGNFIESAFTRDNTIVRAISNIDPVKSGVLLTTLDVQHVHKWAQDLTKLQRNLMPASNVFDPGILFYIYFKTKQIYIHV